MENQNEIVNSPVATDRLQYSSPRFVEYGCVADIVEGNIPVMGGDTDSTFQRGR